MADMDFLQHASAYGLNIRHLISDGKWHRVPTTDKPRKRNGAYLFDGSKGVVRNWATMEGYATWPPKGERVEMVDPLKLRMEREKADREEAAKRRRASIIAQSAVGRAKPSKHPYLERKGFPDAIAMVLENELIVPMRNFKTNKLTSIQRINGHGEKKFLAGGETKGAVFIMGKKRYPAVKILCEGYATALSIKAAADAMHKSCEVWVCFSASNLVYVAERIGGERVVVADNDASRTGQNAARSTGLPWLMSPVEGDDFNDYHQREGLWAAVKLLRNILQKETV
jgi:phage/plasmid primase-like uncharacterized protein